MSEGYLKNVHEVVKYKGLGQPLTVFRNNPNLVWPNDLHPQPSLAFGPTRAPLGSAYGLKSLFFI